MAKTGSLPPSESSNRRYMGASCPLFTDFDRMIAQIDEVADCGADTAVITGHLNGKAFFPSAPRVYQT